jgi:hypothetical protein
MRRPQRPAGGRKAWGWPVQQQAALDPELRAQIDKEAAEYYVTRLTEEFLAKGYSLERSDELIAAIVERLKNGPGNQ